LTRQRLPLVTHTDALFAKQSQSILDNLVALLAPAEILVQSRNGRRGSCAADIAGQSNGCFRLHSSRSWPDVIRQELPPQPTFGQRKQATASVAGGHSAVPERMVSYTETGS
jgi:hypothetical protein